MNIMEKMNKLREGINMNQKQLKSLFKKALSIHQKGDFNLAQTMYKEIIQIDPEHSDAYHLLGQIQAQKGQENQAIESIQKAIKLYECDIYLNSLATIYLKQGFIHNACLCLRKALSKNSKFSDAYYSNLGLTLLHGGECVDAMNNFKKMLELKNDIPPLYSNYLMSLNYVPSMTDQQIYEEHLSFNNLFHLGQSYNKHLCLRPPRKKLRIGYVSSDFCRSSMTFFVEPVLRNHNYNKFEIFCYANVEQPDDVTHRIQLLENQWIDTRLMTDEQMATKIMQDRIDILVDLNGHFSGNRLAVFARQPAPIQVTYLGYPNTTGLSNMQYRLTDSIADPVDRDSYHSEKLIRLPSPFLCYQPVADSPDVSSLPAKSNNYITLGSFNNLAKINNKLIFIWASILKKIPHARLLLKARPFIDSKTQERFQKKFYKHGIQSDQIVFKPYDSKMAKHLMAYHDIDLALDTFPYHGTTTTCDALWMGVPVVTLCGRCHASRVGATILSALGLTDFIAYSPKEYIDKTIYLCQNIHLLKNIRIQLRAIMQTSALMDAKLQTHNIECAYNLMWSGNN